MIDRTDARRGQSIALNYVLVLAISAILVSGLILAGGSFVNEQRDDVIKGELNVIGTHIAGNLEQVDRYVNASGGNPETAYVNQSFQNQVTGEGYNIELDPNSGEPTPPQVVLSTRTADITVRVNATVDTDVEESRANGGKVSVYYDNTNDQLVIDDG